MSSEAAAGEWVPAGGDMAFRWREPDEHQPQPHSRAPRGTAAMASCDGHLRRRRRRTTIAVAVLGLLLLLVLLAYVSFGKEEDHTRNLLLVGVVFRHGDRSPTETYPNDPHQENAWADGFGALTNEGKLQMWQVGAWLRERYGAFLGPLYSPRRLSVKSSAAARCLMSAEALLSGLLPPAPPQRWHPDILWQPIPVRYETRDRDTMIAAKKACKRYDQELHTAYNSPEIQEINANNKEMFQYLTKYTGRPVNNITDVELLYTTLLIEKIHDLELPDWTKSVFPEKMKPLAERSLAIFTFSDFMKRIRGGPLLKEIIGHMVAKREELDNTGRMFLYAAHDLTLINVWRALGISEFLTVEYGGSLIFELRWIRQGIDLEVKVLYLNSSSSTEPMALKIPGCPNPCDLNKFVEVTQHILPGDWEKECATSA